MVTRNACAHSLGAMLLFSCLFQVGWRQQDGATAIAFPDLADGFASRYEVDALPRSEEAFSTAVRNGYVVVRLGLFDLYHPCDPLDRADKGKDFREIANAVLDLQQWWIAWVAEPEAAEVAEGHVKTLKSWIKTWKTRRLAQHDAALDRPDVLERLGAKDGVREASRGFEECAGQSIGPEHPEDPLEVTRMVVCPTRRDFLELGSYLGSFNEVNRQTFWVDHLAMWIGLHSGTLHVLATEYPTAVTGGGDVTQGVTMNSTEKTGLSQHVAQFGAQLLLYRALGAALPEPLLKGLSVNVAIDLYGENNVRAGGGHLGAKTSGQVRFVPEGGRKPGKNRARVPQNRWRSNKGKDYFVAVLRKVQSEGWKIASKQKDSAAERNRFFALEPDSGAGPDHLVRAPLFSTSEVSIPGDYLDDAKEFFRAYGSAFCYWLRHEAHSPVLDEEPEELLRRLLRDLGEFDLVAAETYGVPLSRPDATTPSLELEFLEWLRQGR